jgi:hypothetical protein
MTIESFTRTKLRKHCPVLEEFLLIDDVAVGFVALIPDCRIASELASPSGG